ncbi:hypothetical protein VTJ83DRAFT_283 [Remersonia thermophila]|uniref:Chromatin modification-related protein EAF6 n=1 Tax=Remersonia thermophila TaxID=72144 RepID=A0ABR4DKU2_9PEZI
MTEATPANASSGDTAASSAAGIPFYEKQRHLLKELIFKRKQAEKKLANIEEFILAKESEYLESTPTGNIITGFDNYIKGGTAAAAAQRRKASMTDQNRVFSRSSVSYNPAAAADAQTPASTPASHAPTPVSSSFGGGEGRAGRDGPSGAPTPNSTATGGGGGGGGGGRGGASKKGKKHLAGAEDSETDGREAKKARTNFGARK